MPVLLGLGIGGWFALPAEPGPPAYAGLAALVLALLVLRPWLSEPAGPLAMAVVLVALGAGLAGAQAHRVAAPVLDFRFYGPIEGRVVAIDRSVSDALRLTLDQVWLADVRPGRTPQRVRVSLHGTDAGAPGVIPQPGMRVMLTGHLGPPGGPVEPGGFDFQRHAWFQGLGAVGYTRSPVLMLDPPAEGLGLIVFRLRMALSAAVQAEVPGPAGAFAAAILTGDRSALPRENTEDLRDSNLAHLLAISGLHMGLMTGVVFGAVRGGLALVPWVALRWPIRKIAALAALIAGAGYLALSGGNVATLRAYVMVAVMLVAVLLDRRALSLRSVALAATLILIMMPDALTGPGFQMSFAATIGLVAVFGALRDSGLNGRLPSWLRPVLAVVLSSAVAGLATAPIAAAHFNRIADYGLIANLASVPLMGLVVMPAAVAAAVLWPLGLAQLALVPMRWGLEWILGVAAHVAAWEGAVTPVPAPPGWVLPLLALGALWALLWVGRWRWLGLAGVLAAGLGWAQVSRPLVLIAETGGLVGVLTPEGRALSKPRGDGFAAEVWLENDGDSATQETAAARRAGTGPPEGRRYQIADLSLHHLTGRDVPARLAEACTASLVVVNRPVEAAPPGCLMFDARRLAETGSLALVLRDGRVGIVTARQRAGARMWNTPALRSQ